MPQTHGFPLALHTRAMRGAMNPHVSIPRSRLAAFCRDRGIKRRPSSGPRFVPISDPKATSMCSSNSKPAAHRDFWGSPTRSWS